MPGEGTGRQSKARRGRERGQRRREQVRRQAYGAVIQRKVVLHHESKDPEYAEKRHSRESVVFKQKEGEKHAVCRNFLPCSFFLPPSSPP